MALWYCTYELAHYIVILYLPPPLYLEYYLVNPLGADLGQAQYSLS